MKLLSVLTPRIILLVLLILAALMLPSNGTAQNFIPATSATCDRNDISDTIDTARTNPEWAPVIVDPAHPFPNDVPNILEGWVAGVPPDQNQNSQSSTEVSEEEIPWNHYTHDYTFKVVPDPRYQNLLASWNRLSQDITFHPPQGDPLSCALFGAVFIGNNTCLLVKADSCPTVGHENDPTCHREHMEVEWENASVMKVNGDSANDTRRWGSLPEYAWPSHGDRVWLQGRWIFDCGHAGITDQLVRADDMGLLPDGTHVNDYVKYDTEIHPPRALATFRLNHTVLSREDTSQRDGHPYRAQSDDPSSWLPVTGAALPRPIVSLPPWTPPTLIPVTEADIFVSGNGGGANDLCSDASRSDSSGDCSPFHHTGKIIAVNNYNYVFDIYPPGAHFESLAGNGPPLEQSGAIPVTPPSADASLQWRILDHSGEIPEQTCGADRTNCHQATPILCLIGASTPPAPSDPVAQTQLGTACPALQPGERPTRLRVILPFFTDALNGQVDNYFAQSILLGWDDVPDGQQRPSIRRFAVTLNELKVDQNGRCTICGDADWRVFVDVGGQWRWISWLFDTENNGIYAFNGGDNVLHGDPLTDTTDNDHYAFTRTPWIIDVQNGTTDKPLSIHVAVGGYDSALSDGSFCDTFSGNGCDYGFWKALGFGISDVTALHRIGTYEFDLSPGDCATPCTVQIPETDQEVQYTTSFTMRELPAPTPLTASLQIGDPHFNEFISSATPLTLSSSLIGLQDFQYRFHHQASPLLVYPSGLPFPVYWTSTTPASGSSSASVFLNTASNVGDGPYDFQYAAQSVWNLLETRHTQSVTLDNTAPVITITQPVATQYTHADTITINYNVDDGAGSGVKSNTPTIDNSNTLPGGILVTNGLKIDLFSELNLGSHTFTVNALDNVNNAGSKSVTFSIVVTPDSLEQDANIFLGFGCIDGSGSANALISKIESAKARIAAGDLHTAINTLSALLNQTQAQAGKHIATTCTDPNNNVQFNPAQVLIGDEEFLLAILKTTGITDPILGYVTDSSSVGINGETVTLSDSANNAIASTTTDATGFYFFAQTSTLISGATYNVRVTGLPKQFTTSTPASQSFTWSAAQVNLNNFVLN